MTHLLHTFEIHIIKKLKYKLDTSQYINWKMKIVAVQHNYINISIFQKQIDNRPIHFRNTLVLVRLRATYWNLYDHFNWFIFVFTLLLEELLIVLRRHQMQNIKVLFKVDPSRETKPKRNSWELMKSPASLTTP